MRILTLWILMLGCSVFGIVCAAEPPIPSDAEVASAVSAEISQQDVCANLSWLRLDRSGHMLVHDPHTFDQPFFRTSVAELVDAGLVTRGTQTGSDGKSVATIDLTKEAGKNGIGPASGYRFCYAKRKLERIVAFTPPVQDGDYYVVQVAYDWLPDPIGDRTRLLAKAPNAFGVSEANLTKARSDRTTLIATNQGWKAKSWFEGARH